MTKKIIARVVLVAAVLAVPAAFAQVAAEGPTIVGMGAHESN